MARIRPSRNPASPPRRNVAPLQPSETGVSPYQPPIDSTFRPRTFASDNIVILPNRTATDVILERIRVLREAAQATPPPRQKRERKPKVERTPSVPISKPKRLIEP